MRKTVRLPSLANVTAGGTATLNMPLGMTYETLTLAYTGLTRAQMKDIRLLIDGKPVLEFRDGEQLAALNKYYDRYDEAGFLTIWFIRPEMANLEQQRITGLGTGANGVGVIQTLQLEFDIDAAATSPTVEARAVQSSPKPLGVMTKVKQFVLSSATAGQFEIDNIPKGPRLAAVHFHKTADDISRVEVEQNSRKIFEGDTPLVRFLQKSMKRVPQTGYLSVDWMQEGDIRQSVDTDPKKIQDQRFRLTLGTAGVINIMVEYIDGYQGI